jgi:hypothetical protein
MKLTRKYVEKIEKEQAGSRYEIDSLVETAGFLPLLLLNELYEIIRLKFSPYKKIKKVSPLKAQSRQVSQQVSVDIAEEVKSEDKDQVTA